MSVGTRTRSMIAAVALAGVIAALVVLIVPGPAQADWPPVKLDVSVQEDGKVFTAVVWVSNEGDFDTDVLNVKGMVPADAKYIDSWAGSGRGFNTGVFDGKDVGWVNSGVKAGARQGPFVYMFDAVAVPASPRPTFSVWVSWAGKVPGTAISTVAAGTTRPQTSLKLDSGIGSPPSVGWSWQVMRRTIGPDDVAADINTHGNFWAFYVLKGSTQVGIGESKEVLGVGEATLTAERQEHTHLFPAGSEILGFHVRPSNRPAGDSHGGQLLFTSEMIEAPVADHSVRVRDLMLAGGDRTTVDTARGPFAYVVEGTLSTHLDNIIGTTDAGNVLSLPGNATVVLSNEGTTALKVALVDLHQ